MNHPADSAKFLRAAVKTGLRLQRKADAAADRAPDAKSEGVATLQKIKASLKKRKPVHAR